MNAKELMTMVDAYAFGYPYKNTPVVRRNEMKAAIEDALASPAQQQPVSAETMEVIGWEYRHLDTANTPNRWSEWERCRARNAHISTDEDYKNEIQAYIDMGYNYELRTLYAALSTQHAEQGKGE